MGGDSQISSIMKTMVINSIQFVVIDTTEFTTSSQKKVKISILYSQNAVWILERDSDDNMISLKRVVDGVSNKNLDSYLRRESTDPQRWGVRFAESVLDVQFNGDLNSFDDCRDFLSKYLDQAKERHSTSISMFTKMRERRS